MRISGQSILAGVNPDALQNGRDPAQFQGLNAQGPEGQFGYTVPNLLIDHAMRNPHVPPGFWRGVNNNQNAHLPGVRSSTSWRMRPSRIRWNSAAS